MRQGIRPQLIPITLLVGVASFICLGACGSSGQPGGIAQADQPIINGQPDVTDTAVVGEVSTNVRYG